jgi:hypothetical protein
MMVSHGVAHSSPYDRWLARVTSDGILQSIIAALQGKPIGPLLGLPWLHMALAADGGCDDDGGGGEVARRQRERLEAFSVLENSSKRFPEPGNTDRGRTIHIGRARIDGAPSVLTEVSTFGDTSQAEPVEPGQPNRRHPEKPPSSGNPKQAARSLRPHPAAAAGDAPRREACQTCGLGTSRAQP